MESQSHPLGISILSSAFSIFAPSLSVIQSQTYLSFTSFYFQHCYSCRNTSRLGGVFFILSLDSLVVLFLHLFKQYLWSIYLRPWTISRAKAFTVKSPCPGTAMTMAYHMNGYHLKQFHAIPWENFPASPFITPGSIL